MKCAAIIIDDRPEIAKEAIERHSEFIPKGWPIIHMMPPYENGLYSIKSARDYNSILTNPAFWCSCQYDRVLIFQHDSGLLRHGIEEFLEYDFIGAPLYHIKFPAMNGGLSIRNPEKMYIICNDLPYEGMSVHGNEDIYFCNELRFYTANIPTKEVAQKFSVETIFGLGSLGYHAIDKYMTKNELDLIMRQYL